MANRRFGNNQMGGGQRGPMNRGSFGMGGGGGGVGGPASNISPWQGGVSPAPGNAGNNVSQLALAISSLLQQSQQQGSNNGPPSLLNMNTQPNFYNQDQFNNQNRFVGRRQDFRRPEPYNKNRIGAWRNDGNNRMNNRGVAKNKNQNKNQNANKKKPLDKTPKQEKVEDSATKAEDTSENEATEGVEGADTPKKPGKATKYDGIPKGLLHCFVCNKSMWDGESFQNHIGGKAHKQMINSLEESFQITVNILRENMRLCEERKMIEYERMQRSRRFQNKNQHDPESHCNMCDLKFMGKIVVHRQTEGHQRLKRFLHPKCKRCNLEFPSRMEWVDHQFSSEHLIKLKEYLEFKKLEPSEYKLKIVAEFDNEPLLEENVKNEDDNPVLELTDDMNNLFNRIPAYKADRPVGKACLQAATGFICEICKLYMNSEEDSQTHLKSYHHHLTFVQEIKTRYQKAAVAKRKAEEAAAKAANGEKKEGEGDEEEEGNDEEKAEDEKYDPFSNDADKDEEEEEEEVEAEAEAEAETEAAAEEEEEVKEEEVKKEVEVKEEPKKEEPPKEEKVEAKPVATPPTPTTRQKRNVKNGAGPKSKKARN